MDPIHLRPNELDYELRIRGIVGLSNVRTGTRTIREILKKEALGIEVTPGDSSVAFISGNELVECRRIVESINESIDIAQQNCGSILWVEAEHRILHLKGRLRRIHVQEPHEASQLHDLLVECDKLIHRIAEGDRQSGGNRISFNIPQERQGAVPPSQPAATVTEALPRAARSRGPAESFHSFSLGATNPLSRSTGFGVAGRGRGRGVTAPSHTVSGKGSVGSRTSQIPTPPNFAERIRIPTSPSLFDLDEGGAVGYDRHDRTDINWENELRGLTQRESQTASVGSRSEERLNQSVRAMNLGEKVPTYNRDTYASRKSQNRNTDSTSNLLRTTAQPNFDRATSRRHSDPISYVNAGREDYVPLDTRNIPTQPDPRVGVRDQRDPVSQPLNFANTQSAPYQFESRNSYNGQNARVTDEDYEQRDEDTIFRDLNASNTNYRNNAQSAANRESAQVFANTYTFAYAEEGPFVPPYNPRPPSAPQPHNQYQNRRFEDIPLQSAFAYPNYGPDQFGFSRQAPPANANRQFVPNVPETRQAFVPQPNVRQQQPRFAHKSVPVNHWKVSFSGDGQGLHLFDFLSQVRMLQRSEMIPDVELLPMMVHLFTGRAKNWYGSWSQAIGTWDELVEALRAEFLPENYDFMMLEKITNRKQRNNESVGEFLALMQSQFMWLGVPLAESHKVFIVRNNLLQKFAQGVAPFEVRSLEELGKVCRRIESSSTSYSLGLPFESQNYNSNRYPSRTRAVNEIGEYDDVDKTPGYDEVCAMRRGVAQPNKRNEDSGATCICYNCKKGGHVFRDCKEPRGGLFCYGCGSRDVTTRTCGKCAGNVIRNSVSQVGLQGSGVVCQMAQETRREAREEP